MTAGSGQHGFAARILLINKRLRLSAQMNCRCVGLWRFSLPLQEKIRRSEPTMRPHCKVQSLAIKCSLPVWHAPVSGVQQRGCLYGRRNFCCGQFSGTRQRHHLSCWHVLEMVVAPDLAPAPCTAQPVAQAQHVACNGGPRGSIPERLALHVIHHRFFNALPSDRGGRCTIKMLIPL